MKTENLHRVQIEFNNNIVKYRMLCDAKSVLIALSGGSDSVCLFHLMHGLSEASGVKVYAAHINHCIRGKEADDDESFVRSLCEKFGVQLFVLRENVPEIAKQTGKSLETAARDVRYSFFNKLCDEHGIDKIATAHNSSDNTETFIFNVARGSGLSGLKGIAPVRGRIIRPLITCTKAEIEEYCTQNGYEYRTDKTNFDTEYTRNFIRHEISPRLEKINQNIHSLLRNTCDCISEDEDFIEHYAYGFITEKAESGCFDANEFNKLHPALKKRVIKLLYQSFSGNNNSKMLQSVNIDSAVWFIESNKSGKSIGLPGNVKLVNEFGKIGFSLYNTENLSNVIICDGNNYFGDECITSETHNISDSDCPEIIYTLLKKAFFDSDKIVGDIFVRTRKNSDKIKAENITKSVKEFFINKKIPLSLRDKYPIFCDDEGIIWVPQLSVADRVKVTEKTKRIKIIKIKEKEDVL